MGTRKRRAAPAATGGGVAMTRLVRISSGGRPGRGRAPLAALAALATLLAPASSGETPPANFLRWRNLEEEAGNATVSNDFNERTGTFVTFSPFGLRIGPVSTGATGNGEREDQIMEGLRTAIESHLNATLKDLEPPWIYAQSTSNGLLGGKFAGYVQVDEVRFAQTLPHEEEGELVRRKLEGEESLDAYVTGGRAFYLYGPGGTFMTLLPTSEDLDLLVADNIEKSAEGGGSRKTGDMLAGTLREMATSDDPELGDLGAFEGVETVSVVEGMTLPPTEAPTPSPTPAPLPVLSEEIEEAAVTSTLATKAAVAIGEGAGEDASSAAGGSVTTPGDDSSSSATDAKDDMVDASDQVDTEAGPNNEAQDSDGKGGNADADDNGGDVAGTVAGDIEAPDSEEEGVDAGSDNAGGEVAALEARSTPTGSDADQNGSLGIIVGGALALLLALLAGAALFVYYKRRRHDTDSEAGLNKNVPMTAMTDDEFYDDAYGGLYRGVTPTTELEGPEGGVEDPESQDCAGHSGPDEKVGAVFQAVGGCSALQIVTPTEAVEPEERHIQAVDSEATEDWLFAKMLASAATMRTESIVSKEDPNLSLDPQLDERETSRSIESGFMDASGEIDDRDIIAGAQIVKRSRSLGSQDSLNVRVLPTESRDIADLDILADLGNANSPAPAEDIVYDDIEEAMQLAEAVKRANSIDIKEGTIGNANDIDRTDGFADDDMAERRLSLPDWPGDEGPEALAAHNILADINEAAKRTRSQESLEKARESPALADAATAFSNDSYDRGESHIGLLEDDEDVGASHIDLLEEDLDTIPEEEDGEIEPHALLSSIDEVARSRSMTTPSPALILDSYVPRMASSPSPADPPGDESLVSGGGEDRDVQVAARCGRNMFVQQTKDMLPKRSFMCRQGQRDALPNVDTTIVSDDEDEDDRNISRPWNEKWKDPYSKEASGTKGALRTVSPTFQASNDAELTDGSNYDPDSDWDVDDTELDFGPPGEEFDAAPAARDSAPLRIW